MLQSFQMHCQHKSGMQKWIYLFIKWLKCVGILKHNSPGHSNLWSAAADVALAPSSPPHWWSTDDGVNIRSNKWSWQWEVCGAGNLHFGLKVCFRSHSVLETKHRMCLPLSSTGDRFCLWRKAGVGRWLPDAVAGGSSAFLGSPSVCLPGQSGLCSGTSVAVLLTTRHLSRRTGCDD